MSRRTLALAIAIVMIASALAAVVPAHSASAAPADLQVAGVTSTGTPHPGFSGISIEPYEGYGYYTLYYYPGDGPSGEMYFNIYDAGADHFANVTLNDPNATRDGVGSPAYHVEVPINSSSGEYNSYETAVYYTFPANIVYPGQWVLSVEAPLGGYDNVTLNIVTYYLSASSNPDYNAAVLPGETVTVFYYAELESNAAIYTHLTNLSVYGQYTGNATTTQPLFGHNYWEGLTPSGLGQFSFTVPANATPDYEVNITLWGATFSNGSVGDNESDYYQWWVGVPSINYIYISDTPNVCAEYSSDEIVTGATAFVCAQVGAALPEGGDFTPIGGMTTHIQFWNGTAWVTSSVGAPTELVSNSSGFIAFTFTPNVPPFSTNYFGGSYSNLVNMTVFDPTATNPAGDWEGGYNDTFYLYGPYSATGDVGVVLGQSVYLPGQTITATWTLGSSNPSVGTLTAQAWELESDDGATLGVGAIDSTATTGTLSLTLPTGWVGEFELYIYATNASAAFDGYAYAYVTVPTLIVNPSATTYVAGNTVNVAVSVTGAPTGPAWSIGYTVYAEYWSVNGEYQNEGVFESGTVANGSTFPITVPTADPPAEFEIYVWLESPSTGLVASSTTYIDQLTGYQLTLGLQTQSKYSDGSFQPGQTLTFAYTITPYGSTTLPSVYLYEVYLENTAVYLYLQGSSTSGTFQVTIPSGQPASTLELYMYVEGHGLNGPDCYGTGCESWTFVTVNPSPSALGAFVGSPSTGLTVGWLLLLIIIIVVAVILAVLALRRRRPPMSGGSKSSSMPAPAPAPTSGAPPEWKEPAASDSNQPPMPSPPPGAQ